MTGEAAIELWGEDLFRRFCFFSELSRLICYLAAAAAAAATPSLKGGVANRWLISGAWIGAHGRGGCGGGESFTENFLLKS